MKNSRILWNQKVESREWNPEFREWNPESKDVLDYLTWVSDSDWTVTEWRYKGVINKPTISNKNSLKILNFSHQLQSPKT